MKKKSIIGIVVAAIIVTIIVAIVVTIFVTGKVRKILQQKVLVQK